MENNDNNIMEMNQEEMAKYQALKAIINSIHTTSMKLMYDTRS